MVKSPKLVKIFFYVSDSYEKELNFLVNDSVRIVAPIFQIRK